MQQKDFKAPASPATSDVAALPVTRSPSLDELHGMRILVVDDMPTNIILLRAILEHGGFTNLLNTDDGSKAIEQLESNTHDDHCDIDLVLLDIIMPSKNGYSVCRSMQTHPVWNRIPVIMITSENKWREETARASFDSGATDIMFKPVRSVELLPRVISALGQKWERDTRLRYERQLEATLRDYRIAEARLKYLVSHDDLTGLYNRRRFEQALELAIMYARYYDQASAVFYLDIDHYKTIVDRESQGAGERLLIEIGSLVRRQSHANAMIARILGDEFAVLLEDTSDAKAVDAARELLETCARFTFNSEKDDYPVTVSIGVVHIRHYQSWSASEILSHADYACQQAKRAGRNRLHVFSEQDEQDVSREQEQFWKPLLHKNLVDNGFNLHYQPVIAGRDSKVHHHEVLPRLIDSDGKALLPAAFIPVAERIGVIRDIDHWVTRSVIQSLARNHSDMVISINISGETLRNQEFTRHVTSLLDETGVNPKQLVFEIRESDVVQKLELVRLHMLKLREAGCRFSLDKFGSGTNFNHFLQRLPIEFLKIDGTLVTNLPNDHTTQALVRSIVEIANSFGMKTIAGHVDRVELVEILVDAGVDYLQGNYIGQPVNRATAGLS